MQVLRAKPQLPIYPLEPDEIMGSRQFRMYHFEGKSPISSELLIPHRKDHFLLVFIRRGTGRQWIDTTPYESRANFMYFTDPSNVIVKEEFKGLWSTAIAFTPGFLSLQENASINTLPLIQNPHNSHELQLAAADVRFVEDALHKIGLEYREPGEWQQRMLTAHLTVLLTYLSRLYTEQYKSGDTLAGSQLLRQFQACIDERFRQLHEVSDYASILNISAGHLSEMVKHHSGKPAIKHIHNRLVMETRRLLLHTDQSLKEIAFDLGFSDASYFNRFFKRETGVTPAGYRTHIRKMYHEHR